LLTEWLLCKTHQQSYNVRIEVEAGIGEALDDSAPASREKSPVIMAVAYHGQAVGGAIGE
jgi:hypothetical protein